MSKADLARLNRLDALRQVGHTLADGGSIAHRVAGQVAVDADPVIWTGRALPIPKIGLDELRREPGLLEQQEVDLMLVFDELLGEKSTAIDHLKHDKSVRMFDPRIKVIYRPNSSSFELQSQDLERRELQLDHAVADPDLAPLALQEIAQKRIGGRKRGSQSGLAGPPPCFVQPDDRRVRILGPLDRLHDHLPRVHLGE